MLALFDSQVIRAAEQAWAREQARPTFELMQRAARALARSAAQMFYDDRPVVVLAGRGNNGGDGVLAACTLRANGFAVQIWSAGPPKPGTDAEQAWRQASEAGVPVVTDLAALPSDAHLQIIDALLGTGFRGEPIGAIGQALAWCAALEFPHVLAADCPSGLNADTGQASRAITADRTLTFIGAKPGLFTGQGPGHAGHVDLAPIDAAPPENHACAYLLEAHDLSWPARPAVMHKGAAGQVAVLGGGPGMPGAAALASEAALLAGAGRVSAYVAAANRSVLATRCPEMLVPEHIAPPTPDRPATLIAGPGLGRDRDAESRLADTLARFEGQSQVLDADALWHLAESGMRASGPAVLTPHPGEAARLLGTDVRSVEADRLAAARELQAEYDSIVVLKGAGTIVASARCLLIVPGASGSLATSGLGDVLSGVIGAMLAQGLAPEEAARSGVFALVRTGLSLADTLPVVRATRILERLPDTLYSLGFRSITNGGSLLQS